MSIRKLRAGRVPTVTAAEFIGQQGTIFWDEGSGTLHLSDGETPGGVLLSVQTFTTANVPQHPADGNLWFDHNTGKLFIWFDNFWVDTQPSYSIPPATVNSLGGIKLGPGFDITPDDKLTLNAGPMFDLDVNNVFQLLPGTADTIGGIKPGPGVTITSDGQLIIDTSGLDFSFGDFVATIPANGHATLSSVNANQSIDINSNGTGEINLTGQMNVFDAMGTFGDEPILRVKSDGQIRMLVPLADSTTGALEIVGNTSGVSFPPNQTGVILHVTGNTNLIARNYFDAVNNYGLLAGRRFNGTQGAPRRVLNNDVMLRLVGQAAGAADNLTDAQFQTYGPARISFIANEDQTPTAQGGRLQFEITKNGTVADVGGTNTITVASMDAQNGLTAIKFNGPLTGNVTGKADTAGNADTVTHGVYTTDTGTVTNTMLAGSIANNKLANSSITVNGSTIALGGTATVTAAAGTLTGTTLNSTVVTSSLTTVGTLGSLNVTGAVQAGSLYGKLYRTVRDAGTIGAGGTLTIDFSTDAIVYCVWSDGLNIAYQNYVVGRVVKVMAIKSAGTGTDSISLDGVTAGQVSSGGTTVSATAGATVFMEFISTTTSVGGVFIKL